jgi:general secretion pathway protein E
MPMNRSLERTLIRRCGITEAAWQESEKLADTKDVSVCDILVQKKLVSELQFLECAGECYDIPVWPDLPISQDTLFGGEVLSRRIPIQFLKNHILVPLKFRAEAALKTINAEGSDQQVVIAVHDPSVFQPVDDLIKLLGIREFKLVLSPRAVILSAIALSYDRNLDSDEDLVQTLEDDPSAQIQDLEVTADLLDDTSEAPIIRLVNQIITRSIRARASDIHIEPYQDSLKIRYRVDGILYDLLTPPKWMQPALISRIKVMSRLDIAEKRLPQDGRLNIRIGNQEIDIRVSTIPTAFGERVVLRLLNKSGSLLTLTELGISPPQRELLEKVTAFPNGIFLITGPTGSGKTTTLYAILSAINKPAINIITIEDPVEYQLKGISQIQVNPKIDLTFARGLRSIVRQDPDVILVGEIRDKETADIAVQSALTGHLVFSTLHTNDAASAITRLVDIGVEPFLISSSVIAVAAQRLIRVLCEHCKEPYLPTEMVLNSMGLTQDLLKGPVYQAKGCPACFHTGYRGRTSIFEMMVMDSGLKNLILKTYDSSRIKQEALRKQMVTLGEDGVEKVLNGITTFEEVLRVTQSIA